MITNSHKNLYLTPNKSSAVIEVHIDDYPGATNNLICQYITNLFRAMLHRIYCIFPSPSVSGHSDEELIAKKKLIAQEGL